MEWKPLKVLSKFLLCGCWVGGERPGGGSCLGCRSEYEVKGSEWGWRGSESREIQGIFCRSSPQHWQVCLASSVSSSRKEARELYFHSHPSGGCVLSSFCLPILRLALTSSQVTEPCLPLPGGKKGLRPETVPSGQASGSGRIWLCSQHQ